MLSALADAKAVYFSNKKSPAKARLLGLRDYPVHLLQDKYNLTI
jgi:hypothetical protein